jgi:monothiol glutaredoxin
MRNVLEQNKIESAALKAIEAFNSDVVQEVQQVIKEHEWVIVGMSQNPVVGSARKYLTAKTIPFKYLEYGNYFSQWKQRLAIKLWSGWPTFPQVFHKGILIGGFADLKKYLEKV